MNYFNGGSSSNNDNNYAPPKVPVMASSNYPPSQYGQQSQQPQDNDPFASLGNSSNPPMQKQQQQQQQPPMSFTSPNITSNDPFTSTTTTTAMSMQQPQQIMQQPMSLPSPQTASHDPFASTNTMENTMGNTMMQPMSMNSMLSMGQTTNQINQQQMTLHSSSNNNPADPFAFNTNTLHMQTPPIQDPFNSTTIPQQQQQQSQVNGLFLGMDGTSRPQNGYGIKRASDPTPDPSVTIPPQQQDDEDDDKDLRQAQEAALYAEGILRQQQEENDRWKKGPLGFGLLPKALLFTKNAAQNVPNSFESSENQPPQSSKDTTTTTTTTTPHFQAEYGGDITIQVDDVDYQGDRAGLEENEKRPPWFSAKKTNAHQQQGATTSIVNQESDDSKPGTAAAVSGAALIGGAAGLIALGPITGVVAATAVAVQAAKGGEDGLFRSAGRVVASGLGTAKRFEDKHGVGKKAAGGLAKGVGWIATQASGVNKG